MAFWTRGWITTRGGGGGGIGVVDEGLSPDDMTYGEVPEAPAENVATAEPEAPVTSASVGKEVELEVEHLRVRDSALFIFSGAGKPLFRHSA